ncbi:MAG: hypothetical protein JJE52_05655 [Acidimicrobiia bacterium]|nr:hypothetical protein [Acidimicrobiia bacterium]
MPGDTPTHRLWARLRRPFDTPEVVDAALGLPESTIDQLIGSRVASSDAADRLLARMPIIARALSTAMQSRPERCLGELRGPILWSETMAARGSSAAAPDVFVCAVPLRHYDTDENRILVAALTAIRDAGRATDLLPAEAYDDETLRRARANGMRATRWLASQHLAGVPRTRPTAREMRRVRAGSRKGTYTPALRLLDESFEPVEVDDLLPYCDPRTRTQHALVVAAAERLEERGILVPHFRALGGVLRAGPIEYRHQRVRGSRALYGVLIKDVLVDVPSGPPEGHAGALADLQARADGRRAVLVTSAADLEAALDLALGPGSVA